MSKLYNLARENTNTTGTASTITLVGAVTSYLTFDLAGVQNGDVVAYGIHTDTDTEVGFGTYDSGAKTLTRNVTNSTNGNNRINIATTAQVYVTALKEQIGNLQEANTWNGVNSYDLAPVPTASDGAALGSSSKMWADLFLASGGVINWNASDVTVTHSTDTLTFAGAAGGFLFGNVVAPTTNDAAPLGSTSLSWSDLFLATGGVIDWNSGDVTVTHAANQLTFSGATTGYFFSNLVAPTVTDGAALGSTGFQWADLFLATGGVINWNSGGITISESADGLLFTGASARYNFDNTVSPQANDGGALGTATVSWADLFLASGAVINFNNGNYTLTHSAGNLTAAGGPFTAPAFIPNSATVPSNGLYLPASNTLGWAISSAAEMQLTASALSPAVSDGNALGTTALMWADLFLASGAVINFNNGNYTITHSAGNLTLAGGPLTAPSFIPNSSTVPSNGMYLPAGNTLGFAVNSAAEVQLTSTALSPAVSDGNALGTTALQWSDLFLAAGGVINWNNGAATITESSSSLVQAGTSAAGISYTIQNSDPGALGGILILQHLTASPTANDVIGQISFLGRNSTPSSESMATIEGILDDHTAASTDSHIRFQAKSGGSFVGFNFQGNGINSIEPVTNDGLALGRTTQSWSDLFLANGGVINWNNGNITLTHTSSTLTLGTTTGFEQILTAHGGAFYADSSQSIIGQTTNLPVNFITNNVTKARLSGSVFSPGADDGTALGSTSLKWSDLFLASGGVINWNNGGVTLTESSDNLFFAGASTGYVFDKSVTISSGGLYLPLGGFINWGDRIIATESSSPVFGGVYRVIDFGPDFDDATTRTMIGIGTVGNPFMQLTVSASGAPSSTYPFRFGGSHGIHVQGSRENSCNIYMSAIGSSAQVQNEQMWARAGNTIASPTKVLSNDSIGMHYYVGYSDEPVDHFGLGALLNAVAVGDFTTSNAAIKLVWYSNRQGTYSLSTSPTFTVYGGSVSVGTGSDPGAGGHIGLQTSAGLIWGGGTVSLSELSGSLNYFSSTAGASFGVQNNNAGTTGATIILDHQSASPTSTDQIGKITFRGRDSGAAVQDYAYIRSDIFSTTAGSEVAQLIFTVNTTAGDRQLFLDGNTKSLLSVTDDGLALGQSGFSWSDLFLAHGGVINWSTSNVTITHSTNQLAIGTISDNDILMGSWPAVTNHNFFSMNGNSGNGTMMGIIGGFNSDSGMFLVGPGNISFRPTGATSDEIVMSSTSMAPGANDGNALGTSSLSWADLFLASGGVINWNNGTATITESSGSLTYATGTDSAALTVQNSNAGQNGARIILDTASASPTSSDFVGTLVFRGRDSGAAVQDYASIRTDIFSTTAGSEVAQMIFSFNAGASGTLQMYLDGNSKSLLPITNDSIGLGVNGFAWSDLFLASGAVINFNSSDVTLTHSSDTLTVGGGGVVLAAGTTGFAPLKFQTGTNLTTATAGSHEYDGNIFYSTHASTNRGVNLTEQFLTVSANQTGTNVNTAQTWFPGGGATGLNVIASTSYFFEGTLAWSKSAGTASHTIGIGFGGSATITSLAYQIDAIAADIAAFPVTAVTGITNFVETATNTTAWPTASTSTNQVFMARVEGIVRVNAAGTFVPQFTLSAAPGGAPTIRANSYFRMRPIGTNTVLNVGNWS